MFSRLFSILLALTLTLRCTYGDEPPLSSEMLESKRKQILQEIEQEGSPIWSGTYKRGGWQPQEFCISPRSGIILTVIHEDGTRTFMASGEIASFNEGRVRIRWELDRGSTMPSDLAIVPSEGNLIVVPTGNIHRFYLERRKSDSWLTEYYHREVPGHLLEAYRFADYLSVFEDAFPLVGKIFKIELTSKKRIDGKKNTYAYEQTVQIDLGAKSGVFEGLVFEQGHIGSRGFRFTVEKVFENHSIATATATTDTNIRFSRIGDSVTSGSMNVVFDR